VLSSSRPCAEAKMPSLHGLRSPMWLLLAGGLVLAAGCGGKQEEGASDAERTGKAVAQAAGDTARQASDVAKEAAEKAKTATADLLASVKSEMEKLDRSLPDLERQAGKLRGKARAASRQQLDELKRQTEELRRSALDLKTQAADKLEDARAEFDRKLEKLKKAYEAAAKEMKK
jgi:hypothetical protein